MLRRDVVDHPLYRLVNRGGEFRGRDAVARRLGMQKRKNVSSSWLISEMPWGILCFRAEKKPNAVRQEKELPVKQAVGRPLPLWTRVNFRKIAGTLIAGRQMTGGSASGYADTVSRTKCKRTRPGPIGKPAGRFCFPAANTLPWITSSGFPRSPRAGRLFIQPLFPFS